MKEEKREKEEKSQKKENDFSDIIEKLLSVGFRSKDSQGVERYHRLSPAERTPVCLTGYISNRVSRRTIRAVCHKLGVHVELGRELTLFTEVKVYTIPVAQPRQKRKKERP